MTTRLLGYWLKRIDVGLEENFVRLLADEGLDRRAWQVLNMIAQGPKTGAELDEGLAPFLSATTPSTVPVADRLVTRNWVSTSDKKVFAVTDEGRRAHERVASKVDVARATMTEGISPDEYDTLLALLERIANNVEKVS